MRGLRGVGLRSVPVVALIVGFAFCGVSSAGTVGSKFDMEIYGYVKLDAVYDSQKAAAGDILLYVLPEGESKDSEFSMTARQSRFGFRVKGPVSEDLKATACIEAGFWGEESDPDHKTKLRIRLAYADLAAKTWSVRAGQDWDTYITVIPSSVNFTYFGWQGSPGYRRSQIRVTKEQALGGSWKVIGKAAVANNLGELYRGTDGDLDGLKQNDGDDAAIPEYQGNLILQGKILTSVPSKFSVSGLSGTEAVDSPTKQDKKYDSNLIMGTVYLPLLELGEKKTTRVAVQGAIWQGQDLDAHEAGIGLGINTTLEKEIRATGGWAQLLVDWSKFNFVAGYGVDDPNDKDLNSFATDANNSRCKNEFIMGSVTYALNDAIKLALEVSHLKTSYKDAADADDDRVQGAVFYYF